jgi:hypothetical protein
MNLTADHYQGHAGWRWSLPNGDSVFVAQQGAQVLSWHAAGAERLYLSPTSACDGVTAIRGGVPVCFPQFNQRGSLPKHGFVRNMPWRLSEASLQAPALGARSDSWRIASARVERKKVKKIRVASARSFGTAPNLGRHFSQGETAWQTNYRVQWRMRRRRRSQFPQPLGCY